MYPSGLQLKTQKLNKAKNGGLTAAIFAVSSCTKKANLRYL